MRNIKLKMTILFANTSVTIDKPTTRRKLYSISNVIIKNVQLGCNSNSIHPDNQKAPGPYAAATNNVHESDNTKRRPGLSEKLKKHDNPI